MRRGASSIIFDTLIGLNMLIAFGQLAAYHDYGAYCREFQGVLPPRMLPARFAFSVALRIFLILLDAGLLKRWKASRPIAIGYYLLALATVRWKHPYRAFENALALMRSQPGSLISRLLPAAESDTLMITVAHAAMMSFSILWSLAMVYFLMRKDVKEQFAVVSQGPAPRQGP